MVKWGLKKIATKREELIKELQILRPDLTRSSILNNVFKYAQIHPVSHVDAIAISINEVQKGNPLPWE